VCHGSKCLQRHSELPCFVEQHSIHALPVQPTEEVPSLFDCFNHVQI
jgi:hypothetical protein